MPLQQARSWRSVSSMLTLCYLLSYACSFDAVSCQAEEARKPERDVPIAMLLSLSISTALYVAVSIVITGEREGSISRAPLENRNSAHSTSCSLWCLQEW
jgi:amino acid transporter